jgi:hypothetical protein
MLFDGLPGGVQRYSHAIIALKLKPSDTESEVNVTLHRGMTVVNVKPIRRALSS